MPVIWGPLCKAMLVCQCLSDTLDGIEWLANDYRIRFVDELTTSLYWASKCQLTLGRKMQRSVPKLISASTIQQQCAELVCVVRRHFSYAE